MRAQLPYIAAINCLFAEFDGGADVALAHLEGLPYYPSAVIHSGGGLHCYWLLEDTQAVTESNRAEIAHLQAAWVDLVGADDGAKDLARVLRVPGTQNRKPERRAADGSYPTVTILEYFPYRVYDLARLTALLPSYKPPEQRAAAGGCSPSGAPMAGAWQGKPSDALVAAAMALQRLDSDDYGRWVRVGMALKTSLGDTAGFALWRDWSAKSAKFDAQVCSKKWAALPVQSDITVASLVYWAQGGGR